MKRTSLSLGVAGLALLVLGACDAPTVTSPADSPAKDEELSRLVEAMGFRGDMVQDFGDYVVVEGDIRISKSQLRDPSPVQAVDPLAPRFQYRTTFIVGSPKVSQITVNLSGLSAEPAWQTAARDAMTHWNSISDSYVRMVEVTSGGDISVGTNCSLGFNVVAQASWPSGGNPGPTIHVNPCFGYSIGSAQRLHNMVHEFGHTLGFRHTNWQSRGEGTGTEGAVHIAGTPTGNDSGSVMNGGTALNSWAGFSAYDLIATRRLYPLPRPTVSVSYPGDTNPVIGWTPVPGASMYFVIYEVERWDSNGYQGIDRISVAATSGTSATDWARTYTGIPMCDFPGGVQEIYSYRVETIIDNKRTSGLAAAQTGVC